MLTRFRKPLQITLALYWGVIFTLTHVPGSALPHFNIWDKLEHCLAYLILSCLLLLYIRASRPTVARPALVAMAICCAYGAIDEWLQIPVGRDCSILDWVADVLGTVTGVALVTLGTHNSLAGTHNSQHTTHKEISNDNKASSKAPSASL